MTELAEALRSLDDTRKQKNDVSRELKELKYAGVGACPGGVYLGAKCPPSSQGRAWPSVPSLCLILSICRMGPNAASTCRVN